MTPIIVTVYAGGFLEGVVYVDDWTIRALKGKEDHIRWLGGENYNRAAKAVLKEIQRLNKLWQYKIIEPRRNRFAAAPHQKDEMILVDIKPQLP
jgi:hypothetical protein